jgi:hypothetical protein
MDNIEGDPDTVHERLIVSRELEKDGFNNGWHTELGTPV